MRQARVPVPDPVGPGQESVWDYPRPPRLEPSTRRVRVELDGIVIAESSRALRVLETSHPPTYYVHPDDVVREFLERASGDSWCEWKGRAVYWTVQTATARVERGAWSYRTPLVPFDELADHLAFYPALFSCHLDDERVMPQPGGFYGGWVTNDLAGPFKGGPGTMGW
ncbi:MAG: DUF427 domain-containing protein [Acidimicrobiia bacterium]